MNHRAAWLVAMLVGCGARYPSPFTAEQMARLNTGDALVAYLSQPGATAAVCDRTSQAPHFERASDDDFESLVDGLRGGAVEPDLWQRCTMLMLEHMPRAEAPRLLEAMVRGDRALLSSSAVESDPKAQARTEAMHRALLLRPRGTAPRAQVVAGDIAALRDALAKHRLGPVASKYGKDLVVAIDLESGTWRGRPLSVGALDALFGEKDEASLRRISMRAPDADIQNEARRRVVRLHIASTSNKQVRDRADEVEEIVTKTGRNAIDVGESAPASGWIDAEKMRVRGVLVRQDVWNQTSTLLAYEGDRPGSSVLPSISLRGAFWARVPGFADPVTLCAAPDALDVTPCMLPADLHPKVPIVYVDAQGLLHFVERVASADAIRLVYNTPNLPLPFDVLGRTIVTVQWPIVFERPPNMVFAGPPEGRGPDLRVTLGRRYSPRLLFDVRMGARTFVGVVEEADLSGFSIVSLGGAGVPGQPGSPGANGASGSAGAAASCPYGSGGAGSSGSPGGNGSAGTAGGPGGPGGDIEASVACATGDCKVVASLVRRVVRSEGGAGGAGGQGGRGGTGGAGGAGGSGASCTDAQGHYRSVPAGSPGMKGPDGMAGANGANGRSGAPGRVDFHVARD